MQTLFHILHKRMAFHCCKRADVHCFHILYMHMSPRCWLHLFRHACTCHGNTRAWRVERYMSSRQCGCVNAELCRWDFLQKCTSETSANVQFFTGFVSGLLSDSLYKCFSTFVTRSPVWMYVWVHNMFLAENCLPHSLHVKVSPKSEWVDAKLSYLTLQILSHTHYNNKVSRKYACLNANLRHFSRQMLYHILNTSFCTNLDTSVFQ